jgi:hypothetical protein
MWGFPLSACFVLHGASLLLPRTLHQDVAYNSWPLLGLSSGYILALAVTAVAIVRYGKVWDDARSILLIIAVWCILLRSDADGYRDIASGAGAGAGAGLSE